VEVDLVQLENNMKKIYFDGCSYTFGQSLELYCNPLDIFTEKRMSHYSFTNSDIEFLNKNRYSGLVSQNLKFDETNLSKNGKSNGRILFDLKKQNIDEYEYVIIQLTHFGRFFTNNMHDWISSNDAIEYLLKNKILSKDVIDYTIDNIDKIQYEYYLELISLFKNCPNKLKIIFHSNEWESILTKQEIEKYGITIDGEYMIRKWAENNNMFINQEPQFKTQIATAYDTHLTLEGHKILAEQIIKQL
jgi:hypothetical protein